MAQIPVDPFNSNMDDLFNQLMGNMGGLNSERRYLINGREVTPEEYAQFRQTGQLPGTPAAPAQSRSQKQPAGILAKLGRNLTAEA